MDGDLLYWNNIQQLMEELKLELTFGQWRLSIDSSTVSLKAVLIHKGNKFLSLWLAHAVHVKETYENRQVLMEGEKKTLWRTPAEYIC